MIRVKYPIFLSFLVQFFTFTNHQHTILLFTYNHIIYVIYQ